MTVKSTIDNLAIAAGKALTPKDKGLEKRRQSCIAAGGVWNSENYTCTFPEPQQVQAPTATQTPPPVLKDPESIISGDTGKVTGINLPSGKTLLGADRNTLDAVAGKQAEGKQLLEGTAPAGTARRQAELQQQIQQAMQAAEAGVATPEQLAMIQGSSPDIGQALGAGVVGAVPGILGGIATGAAGGAAVGALGAGVGAIPGAIIGGVLGGVGTFLISTRSNLKTQQTDAFAQDQEALRKGNTYLRALITDTNKNPQNAPENIALFYQTLNMIDAAHARTARDSQENLNKFLGKDGTRELSRFEVFDKTMRNYYISQFQSSLAMPDPNKNFITIEDMQDDLQESLQ